MPARNDQVLDGSIENQGGAPPWYKEGSGGAPRFYDQENPPGFSEEKAHPEGGGGKSGGAVGWDGGAFPTKDVHGPNIKTHGAVGMSSSGFDQDDGDFTPHDPNAYRMINPREVYEDHARGISIDPFLGGFSRETHRERSGHHQNRSPGHRNPSQSNRRSQENFYPNTRIPDKSRGGMGGYDAGPGDLPGREYNNQTLGAADGSIGGQSQEGGWTPFCRPGRTFAYVGSFRGSWLLPGRNSLTLLAVEVRREAQNGGSSSVEEDPPQEPPLGSHVPTSPFMSCLKLKEAT